MAAGAGHAPGQGRRQPGQRRLSVRLYHHPQRCRLRLCRRWSGGFRFRPQAGGEVAKAAHQRAPKFSGCAFAAQELQLRGGTRWNGWNGLEKPRLAAFHLAQCPVEQVEQVEQAKSGAVMARSPSRLP
jgi:hypothetical protein